jgi:hypothetical protein
MLSKRNMLIIGSISLVALAITISVQFIIKKVKEKQLDKKVEDINKDLIETKKEVEND